MNLTRKLEVINSRRNSYWSERIAAEMLYAYNLSCTCDRKYEALVEEAADLLISTNKQEGVITESAARKAEQILLPMAAEAKKYKIRCISHAHIDMNWMWGMPETASVTLDTFRTILELMREYPEMTYAQSQASTYRIIEEYAPEMLPEIRQRVKEGRWEVSATAWVEADKNMTGSESLIRHIQYTREYLAKLLDIPADSVKMTFEPDTFGHNITMPEIYANGGIKYLYHCRGQQAHSLYNWRARSGAEVLVYCEPKWYNATIASDMLVDVPLFCQKYGVDVMLKVYGVGDHGGGPTRRDITRIIDMMTWPIQPTITFGTYDGFFKEVEKFRANFPVVEGELNYVFTGCYTSQSKIKAANRLGEARIGEAEVLTAASAALGGYDHKPQLKTAWEKILFNHFHDILPGSGVADTREYALGAFQQAMAGIGTSANMAMQKIAEAIDTSSIQLSEDYNSISEGAGVGYSVGENDHYIFQTAERGLGRTRIFHLFNTTQYDYDGAVTLTAWDWQYNTGRAVIATPEGEKAAHKLLSAGNGYWGHRYTKFAIHAHVPAFGYATYTLDETDPSMDPHFAYALDPRVEHLGSDEIVLDNGVIRAVFDRQTMLLLSLVRKDDGKEMIEDPSAMFRFIKENSRYGMTSWREGDPVLVECLNEKGKVRVSEESLGGVKQWVKFEIPFATASKLTVTVTLDSGSALLDFDVTADFREIGGGGYIPQLSFLAPIAYAPVHYRYDVPFGTIDRSDLIHDVPALSLACAVPEAGAAMMLTTDTKYGYRGHENALGVNLIRGSYDPDPLPEFGPHRFRIGLGVAASAEPGELLAQSARFNHPVTAISVRRSTGTLPMSASFLKTEGTAAISVVKNPEEGTGAVVRLSDVTGSGSDYALTFVKAVQSAVLVDASENEIGTVSFEGNTVRGSVKPYAIETVLVRFAD